MAQLRDLGWQELGGAGLAHLLYWPGVQHTSPLTLPAGVQSHCGPGGLTNACVLCTFAAVICTDIIALSGNVVLVDIG